MNRGIPDVLMARSNKAQRVTNSVLPSPGAAVHMYTSSGGNLRDPGPFGIDPIDTNSSKTNIRSSAFSEKFPSFSNIFHEVVNGNSSIFQQGLLFFINITKRLASS